MYYEVDQSKKKIRPLPGYFPGFKDDLKGVDPAILSDFQADYLNIPDENIVEVSDEEHNLFFEKQKRISEIKSELHEIDMKSIRPARAGETTILEELESKAKILRSELKKLEEEN
jgi:hypothetical protein